MAAQAPSRHRRNSPPKAKDDRTKVDKWLDAAIEKRTPVIIRFAEPPLPDSTLLSRVLKTSTTLIAMPITCDRYFIMVELQDGQTFWFAKSNILSIGNFEEGDNLNEV